ncbi:unnamed protein product, partial [Vitis vinifera]|uniref:Uncharacterized protein n=1 Tax=Vitis vinifera TaxID=29760 RepID=D7SYI4_VITVI
MSSSNNFIGYKVSRFANKVGSKGRKIGKKRIERKSKQRRKKTLPAVVPKSRNFLHCTWVSPVEIPFCMSIHLRSEKDFELSWKLYGQTNFYI